MEGKEEVYSHSRLWLYENCPEYFKIKYLDKALPDLPVSMALFLGGVVHESLEWLYFIMVRPQYHTIAFSKQGIKT